MTRDAFGVSNCVNEGPCQEGDPHQVQIYTRLKIQDDTAYFLPYIFVRREKLLHQISVIL